MQKRLQNQLYVGYPLGTLKNTIFDVKTSPRRTPKISDFFQKSSKNATYDGLWSKMPLGSLQEPAKSLPGPSQEPFKGPQEAPKSLQEAPCSLPRAVSKAPKGVRELSRGTWHLTPGIRNASKRRLVPLACVSEYCNKIEHFEWKSETQASTCKKYVPIPLDVLVLAPTSNSRSVKSLWLAYVTESGITEHQ